jgi:hypothetical protein
MVLSDTLLLVRLPSGNCAVYSLQPQHLNKTHYAWTLNQSALDYGRQLAHELDGQWYKPGSWEEITDLRTIALLERSPKAWETTE